MSNTVSQENPIADEGASSDGGQRRLLLVVGGAALLLVLGLAGYFLFLSGGDDEEAFGPLPTAGTAAPDETTGGKDKASKKDKKVPNDVDANFTVGRDPFTPLGVEAVTVSSETTTETTDTTSDTSGTTTTNSGGNTGAAPAPAPTSSSTPTPTPTADTVTSYKVTLRSVDFGKDTAVIEVNGKRYPVKVKDMFTNSKTGPFKLTRVGELPNGKDTATVIFGSDAPVELVVKDTVVFKL